MEKVVSLINVSKSFGKLKVLENVNLTIRSKDAIAVVGKSGCGKTTLLRLIAGLETPTTGYIERNYSKLGYVFQEDRLIAWKTVYENLAFVCEDEVKIREVLDLVKLKDFAFYKPHQLSGGMRQRVNLARALVYQPQLLLLDEPFQSLDLLTKVSLVEELSDIFKKLDVTYIIVTHDVRESVTLARKIYVLAGSPATIVDEIEVEKDTNFLDVEQRICSIIAKYENQSLL
ncbi:ABC transporter ATP-binding protein [Pseudothermotoga thermarum]|uniref:ABC transporter related protein n=1 Tax=Pseudothermotoga thermarum DSM 5069 TaxID=688269 RepID=F7YWS0_9THEM|nr:ABC transporter ATP-binding protein [Pseudothermotoga thermarum]AEH50201.1 ABC transporter related protein [Pseudothermotoga thermarum DSM 5069]